jgi:starch synthase
MNIVLVSSEVTPFARSGGLGDGVGALARALALLGVNVSVVTPYYNRLVQRALQSGELDPGHHGVQRGPKDVAVELGAELIVGKVYLSQLAGGVRVYLVGCDRFFDRDCLYGPPRDCFDDNYLRFGWFSRATLEVVRRYGLHPDVLHCHDWQTALVPVYSEQDFSGYFSTLLTIHDTTFQGRFAKHVLPSIGVAWDFYAMEGLEYYGDVSFLKGGILFATRLATVSPTYAVEIRTDSACGQGLDGVLRARQEDLVGILDGIDTDEWNPATDPHIAAVYGPDRLEGKERCKAALRAAVGLPQRAHSPLALFVARQNGRTGNDLLVKALPQLLRRDVQLVVLATDGFEFAGDDLRQLRARHPEQVALVTRPDDRQAHDLVAGADLLLEPSHYEPCGSAHLRALRYGTVPVVRATGGLADAVDEGPEGVGFRFEPYRPDALLDAVDRALSAWADEGAWSALVRRGMARDHSWERTARAYLQLYADVVAAT